MNRMVAALVLCFSCQVIHAEIVAPQIVHEYRPGESENVHRLPDGTFQFFAKSLSDPSKTVLVTSTDNGLTWNRQEMGVNVPQPNAHDGLALVDSRGEIHFFYIEVGGRDERDIWHVMTSGQRTKWETPQMVYDGRVGSLRSAIELSNGRIILPHQYKIPGRKTTHPTGWGMVTVDYSDDFGKTWKHTDTAMSSPCSKDYLGTNVGATEPGVIEIKPGLVWMLMRTQTGFLYESFSSDGINWSEARPSRFKSHNAPTALTRLNDGRIVLIWNNCMAPPKIDGKGIYGGRDALHAAVSHDGGKTWRGFREIYRDATRNDTPPKSGDRGTAYPSALTTQDGRVLVATGQGEGRRVMLVFDPVWLDAKSRSDDFSKGLDHWCVYKQVGQPEKWWCDRVQGAKLVEHPDRKHARVLKLMRPQGQPGDGAVWNFPAGEKGTLKIRLRLEKGFGGIAIALDDAFYDPIDPAAEEQAVFALSIHENAKIAEFKLDYRQWYEISMEWDVGKQTCRVYVNGQKADTLSLKNNTANGISYLHMRSIADGTDSSGVIVERVESNVE